MKKIFLFILFYCLKQLCIGQERWAEELRRDATNQLKTAKDDRTRFYSTLDIFNSYIWSYPDSAAPYAQQAILLARKMRSDTALAHAYGQAFTLAFITGNYPQALQYAFEGLKSAERTKDFRLISGAYQQLSGLYSSQDDHVRGIFYGEKSRSIYESHFTPSLNPLRNRDTLLGYVFCINELSGVYEKANKLDTALKYIQFVKQGEHALGQSWAHLYFAFGNIYLKMGEYSKAISYYRQAMDTAVQNDVRKDLMDICFGLANAFKITNQPDSGIFYANKVLDVSKSTRYLVIKKNTLELIANLYKKTRATDSAAKYFELALAAKDSLFNQDKAVQMQNLTFNEQLRQQDMLEEQQKRQYRYRLYTLVGGVGVLLIIAFILYRNNQQKQKANILLQRQKEKVEVTLSELRATQAQLIQSEKMASLGELTAGIAHEIQNPLNFVNNFSEVNKELLTEMKEEIDKGNLNAVKAIANDVIENQEKINQHGKRADAIVKGMLQHSRTSSGQKEPTDINALTDEYLRLAYHRLRAKDKSFNAIPIVIGIETDFDPTIEKINVVPQEIGRVILNLINNAFYAVSEKHKKEIAGYQPTLIISTKKIGDKAEIRVKDNGTGIPQKVVEKIFQPFFTTKPTGQGTGLGLSLAYDIIKAHGGEIKVETKEAHGSAFVIHLPLT